MLACNLHKVFADVAYVESIFRCSNVWKTVWIILDMQPAHNPATPYLHAALRALAGANVFFQFHGLNLRKQFR